MLIINSFPLWFTHYNKQIGFATHMRWPTVGRWTFGCVEVRRVRSVHIRRSSIVPFRRKTMHCTYMRRRLVQVLSAGSVNPWGFGGVLDSLNFNAKENPACRPGSSEHPWPRVTVVLAARRRRRRVDASLTSNRRVQRSLRSHRTRPHQKSKNSRRNY